MATAIDNDSYSLNDVKKVPDEESPLMDPEEETRQYVAVTIFFSLSGAVVLVSIITLAVMYNA